MKIAVIGGGVAGGTVARYLSEMGLHTTLFEKRDSLMSGPPMCHLHAGGNLYREISDAQCITLLEQSIDFANYYPEAIDFRPTVIIVPKDDALTPTDQLARLDKLKQHYRLLTQKDEKNAILGDANHYYRVYTKEQCEALAQQTACKHPKSDDEWMVPVVKMVDLEKVQFPLIMVQEYGINLFRLASTLMHRLKENPFCSLKLNHKVTHIQRCGEAFSIAYEREGESHTEAFDFLINATGFQTGTIDNMLGFKQQRFVEFKAAYVTQWESDMPTYPEIIFHGERGTPRGMAQFTPYPDNHFQLHGMTQEITLFKDGLVQSTPNSAQPTLPQKFYEKIETQWRDETIQERTQKAIAHVAHYIPAFATAKVASQPLFGAQQIPGNDETLRAADVSFEGNNYARCEIVKSNSVLAMSKAIVQKLIESKFISKEQTNTSHTHHPIEENRLHTDATNLAKQRAYPEKLGSRCVVRS
jgi:2-polyprenyl-6-methoxyphenol hydroxylase-like FAD-dependent oxidoreductase